MSDVKNGDLSASRPRRSVLFVSGLKLEDFDAAKASGADIVCIDLEDAVPPERKGEARERTLTLLDETRPLNDDCIQVVLRINSLRSAEGMRDVLAFTQGAFRPPALLLPKVNTAAEIQWADELLTEARSGADLYCIIESNAGLYNVHEIACSTHRLKALFFGGFDMSAALGAKMAWEPLLYSRGRAVHAAAAAGIDILDSPYPDLDDHKGLVNNARQAQDLGFVGKAAKHPSQIVTINEVFTPDTATLTRAKRIVEAFENDPSAALVIDGRLVEKPTIRSMQRALANAKAAGHAHS